MADIIRVDKLSPQMRKLLDLYNEDKLAWHVRGWLDTMAEVLTREQDIGKEFDILAECFTKLGHKPSTLEDFDGRSV